MKFYDREKELEIIERNRVQSEEGGLFTFMIGRRRIGKTSLLLEGIKGQKSLYLFVSRKTEPLLCAQFQEEAVKSLGLRIFGTIASFPELLEQLLVFSEQEPYTLIIDEFQDLERVNPSIFSDIQNIWDRRKAKSRISFIACGSIYSMMVRIFENSKEPLFGRADSKIILRPFRISVIKEILRDYNPRHTPEDLLCLYMLSGGVPKYISLLMDAGAVNKIKMLKTASARDSPFLNEGRDILVSEFGKDYGTYFSILQLIAQGKNTQAEVDSIIGKNTGAYLAILEKEYSLISRSKPFFSKPESRNIHWKIGDNYLRFYFRFIYANQSLIETEKNDLLLEFILADYETYSGYILEQYFRERISEEERVSITGSYWDRKGENEIDIIALNDFEKTALIAEVKRNPKKIDMVSLAVKAEKIMNSMENYRIEYKGFSLKDM
jgi:AAA+ ATPase superfamily predicted ATPase